MLRPILIIDPNNRSHTRPGNIYKVEDKKGEATTSKLYGKLKKLYIKAKPLHQTEERTNKDKNH